jgi:hypothetical protein
MLHNEKTTHSLFFMVKSADGSDNLSVSIDDTLKTESGSGSTYPDSSGRPTSSQPSNSLNQQILGAGGCGIITPKDRKAGNLGQTTDMLAIIGLMILMILSVIRKLSRQLKVKMFFLPFRLAGVFAFTTIFFLFLFLYGCGDVSNSSGGSSGTNQGMASLTWFAPTTNTDGTPLSDLAGFKIYYGTAPGVYGTPLDVGNTNTYTISGLSPGTYYFAVTAYDASGSESERSGEASKVISGT